MVMPACRKPDPGNKKPLKSKKLLFTLLNTSENPGSGRPGNRESGSGMPGTVVQPRDTGINIKKYIYFYLPPHKILYMNNLNE